MKVKLHKLDAEGKPALDDAGSPVMIEVDEEILSGNYFPASVVKELRDENAQRRIKMREFEQKVTDYETKFQDVDLEEIKALKLKQKELETKKLMDQGEFDKLKGQMVDEHRRELDAATKREQALLAEKANIESELATTIINNAIAFEGNQAECLNLKLLTLLLNNESKIETLDNGIKRIVMLDADGNKRINGKTGELFTIKDRLAEMKTNPEFAMLFKGGKYGTGSHNDNNGDSGSNPWKKETFNLTEQGKILRSDPEKARRLAAAAGVSAKF